MKDPEADWRLDVGAGSTRLPEILLKPRQSQTSAAAVDQLLGIRIAGAGFMGLQQANGPLEQLPVSRKLQIRG